MDETKILNELFIRHCQKRFAITKNNFTKEEWLKIKHCTISKELETFNTSYNTLNNIATQYRIDNPAIFLDSTTLKKNLDEEGKKSFFVKMHLTHIIIHIIFQPSFS